MDTSEFLTDLSLILVVVGAIDLGIWGLFQYNLIDALFGGFTVISRIIFVIMGVAGLYCLSLFSPLHQHARETR